MSTIAVNSITDADGGSNAVLYGPASPAGSMGFRNRIINGDMRIDQRNAGASVTNTGNDYYLDRWKAYGNVSSKFSVQQNAGSITLPVGYTNYLGITSLSAYSVGSSDQFRLQQLIEGFNVADLGFGTADAKTITLSFWVRSSLTGTFGGALNNSGYARSYPFTYTISSANTWTAISITIPGDTSGTWLTTNGQGLILNFGLGVGSTLSGTAGSWASATYISATGATSVVGTSGATLYITGVQLEVGSVATEFERRPYGTELFLCQRYFYKTFNQSTAPANGTNYRDGIGVNPIGVAYITSEMRSLIAFPQPMRVKPTIAYFSTDLGGAGAGLWSYYNGTNWTAVTAITTGESSELYVSANLNKTGLTSGSTYLTSGQLTASAEL